MGNIMKITIISSSLNKKSRSLILSKYAEKAILNQNIACTLIDLKNYNLPFCGTEGAYEDKNVLFIKKELSTSGAIIVSGPIYNNGVNAATKNILDLTGESWEEKTIGFMCMAGGKASYMSILGFANSLMLNSRCLIVPRFVYALPKSFDAAGKTIVDTTIKERIEELCQQTILIANALIENK
jgi:FMN reductase